MALEFNDFIGSIAHENVSFQTQVVKSASVGAQYHTLMIFCENSRYVDSSAAGWEVPDEVSSESVTIRAISLTTDTYAEYTKGLLQSWLTAFFAGGTSNNVILVACGNNIAAGADDDATAANVQAFIDSMTLAYSKLKVYGYLKTVIAGMETNGLNAQVAVKLAELCAADAEYISSWPFYPLSSKTPASDLVWQAVNNSTSAQAFFVYHKDVTINAALMALGEAMGRGIGGSGTEIGNQMAMVRSNNIVGEVLTSAEQGTLKSAGVGWYKPIGDNTKASALMYCYTNQMNPLEPYWAKAYIIYMSRVAIAKLMTTPGFRKNAANYQRIVNALGAYVSMFVGEGNVFDDGGITAPGYQGLPVGDNQSITVPNAWYGIWRDVVRNVRVTGTMYIEM